MIKKIALLLLVPVVCFGSNVVIFDINTDRVVNYLPSVSTPDFQGRSDVLINPDLTALVGVPMRYWKHSGGVVIQMTAPERSAVDAEIVAAAVAEFRGGGKAVLDTQTDMSVLIRAFADITKDELNALRQWLTDFKGDVAAATSLADLKTRVAANPSLPDRDLGQLRTAIKNRIDSGSVDN